MFVRSEYGKGLVRPTAYRISHVQVDVFRDARSSVSVKNGCRWQLQTAIADPAR